MWTVYITSISHVLKVNEYGGRQVKVNEKRQCFKGWETLVDKYGGIDKLQNKCNEVTKKIYGNQAKQGHNPC